MKITNPEVKSGLTRRLRKIEGQVRGVQKMIDEDRDCRDILQQLTAIRSAVQGVSLAFINEVASDCVLNLEKTDPAERTVLVSGLLDLFGKASG